MTPDKTAPKNLFFIGLLIVFGLFDIIDGASSYFLLVEASKNFISYITGGRF